ncbi:hypothetical protein P4284_23105 [Bacillus swezeyi]|uniref:hypothetical protein n=1 Tax=Bacillus swezeyi TaxID=1925020 RepID=UPI002E23B0B6|nr:hypothetical protein [Bacillus swezeyi]MED2979545.1 hypothetical protein [Bacillus swezeyi]
MSVERLCGAQCTEDTIDLVRKQLLRQQNELTAKKAKIEAEITRLKDRLKLANRNLEEVTCQLGKIQCKLEELDCLEKSLYEEGF